MSGHYIDYWDVPSGAKCAVALSANAREELLDAAVEHASRCMGKKIPPTRQQLLEAMKEGSSPA